jgi:hypothetical protein
VAGESRPLVGAWIGAAVVVAVALAGTTLLFSVDAWSDWWRKVTLLAAEPHANHIGLRALVGGSEHGQLRVLGGRTLVHLTAVGGFVTMIVMACRGKRPDQAAIFGLALTPVLFYPANYYIHFIFLLPLLMTETREGIADLHIPLPILALCVAQFFTVPVTPTSLHFYQATVLLFAALGALLVGVLHGDARAGRWPAVMRWLGAG